MSWDPTEEELHEDLEGRAFHEDSAKNTYVLGAITSGCVLGKGAGSVADGQNQAEMNLDFIPGNKKLPEVF